MQYLQYCLTVNEFGTILQYCVNVTGYGSMYVDFRKLFCIASLH